MVHFQNEVKETSYVIYAMNPEPCEPQVLFFGEQFGKYGVVESFYEAVAYNTLSGAVKEFAAIKDEYATAYPIMDICKIETVLNTVNPADYNDNLINTKRDSILSKLSEEDLAFIRFHGLYPEAGGDAEKEIAPTNVWSNCT